MRHALPRVLGLVLLPAALAACTDAESRDTAEMTDTTADAQAPAAETGVYEPGYEVQLTADFQTPQGMAEGAVRGTAEVLMPTMEMEGTPTPHLRVQLSGLAPGDHAWHVHSGPCGTPAPVEIPLTATAEMEGLTGPLVADEQGEATAEVPVPPLRDLMLGEGQYSLHVHESGGVDHGATVACADL